jgi:DNA repair protein RecO (recombination protein O)
MNKVQLEKAYVLHRRPYRETSSLVDIFTPDHGRLTLIAKGVRQVKSQTQGLLEPFVPLLISWSGKSELMSLTAVEARGEVRRLYGECLFAGFYLNELIMSLLEKWDAHPKLYYAYEKAINGLQEKKLEEKVLRSFEKCLLEELGYGLLPTSVNELDTVFQLDKYYRFIPEQGFILSELGDQSQAKSNIFSGKSLVAIAKEDWFDSDVLNDAKRLIRFVLTPLLGGKEIYSRKLFVKKGME